MSRLNPWSIANVLDFESLLTHSHSSSVERARASDQALFVEKIAPALTPATMADRRVVFRKWLDVRRGEMGSESPGKYFDTGWQTLLTVGVAAGLLLGGAVAGGLLHYHGDEPVNAIDFLKWTLGPQWLFLFGALLFWVLRRVGVLENWEPLRALLRGMLDAFAALLRRLPGEKRVRAQATLHALHEHRERYGALATWPVLIATQVFAVCFNLGILGTLLAELPVHELRFGWQTTLDLRSEKVGRFVAAIAAPWSWAPNAHPTASQVTATRYAPGQRHETLPGEAMRAWWPFLFYAVVFYGLAVRGALLVFASVKLRAGLRGLRFDHPDANALWHRLTGPMVTTQNPVHSSRLLESVESPMHAPAGNCYALMASELDADQTGLRHYLASTYAWQLADSHSVKIDNRRESAAPIAAVRKAAPSLASVVIVVPADRDPIVAIALFLQEVIAAAGSAEVLLLLTGAAAVERAPFWRNLKAEHHLRLGIETWPTN